jgi:hypothetical protein
MFSATSSTAVVQLTYVISPDKPVRRIVLRSLPAVGMLTVRDCCRGKGPQ